MTVAAEKVMDSPTRPTAASMAASGAETPTQVLAVTKDQEEAVVGAGSEHQGGEQQLRAARRSPRQVGPTRR